MKRDHLLIIGVHHPLGKELTRQLRKIYGASRVITTDLPVRPLDAYGDGPHESLDLLEKDALSRIISRYDITQIYLLASGQSDVLQGTEDLWKLSLLGLLNVLKVAREKGVARVFWPSSVSVFGADAPRWKCPQDARIDPSTPHGLSKMTGENWCRHYWEKFAVDVRSLRYPGILGPRVAATGELTDYVNEMLQHALLDQTYHCYLQENAILPMIYMPDAVRAAIEIMEAPATAISVRDAYNIGAISVSPREIALTIQRYIPGFKVEYTPDHRQRIAEGTPMSIEDIVAVRDWRWDYTYGISETVRDLLAHLSAEMKPMSVHAREFNGAMFF